MAAFPEVRSSLSLLSISAAVLLLFSSCSSGNVLVLSDPGFDYFAGRSMRFYELGRELIFRLKGFNPDFVVYDPDDGYEKQINAMMESGRYDAVVTGIAPAGRITIPEGMRSVLIGGSAGSGISSSAYVCSTALPALREAGAYMKDRYSEDGLEPVVIIFSREGNEREALVEGWGAEEAALLDSHTLEAESRGGDIRKVLESFLGNYDLDAGRYMILGYCAPVMQEFFEILYTFEPAELILEMPDASLLPEEPEALITMDFKGLLKAAAAMLKSSETGEIRKVPNLFLVK